MVATSLESGSIPWTHLVVWNKHWVKAIRENIDTSQTGPTMFLFDKFKLASFFGSEVSKLKTTNEGAAVVRRQFDLAT